MESLVNTLPQLAVALRSRRKSSRLTQAAVSARVGLLPKTVSALENHPGRASLESLFKLLAALDLELVLQDRNSQPSQFPPAEW